MKGFPGHRPLSVAPFPKDALPFAITRDDAKVVVYGKDLAAPKPKPKAPEGYDEMD